MHNLLVQLGVSVTFRIHTFDGSQTPPAPAAVDGGYTGQNTGAGLPGVNIFHNGADVTADWTVAVTGPKDDYSGQSYPPNAYDVALTANSGSGQFDVVVEAQVNSYEGSAVAASVEIAATQPVNVVNIDSGMTVINSNS